MRNFKLLIFTSLAFVFMFVSWFFYLNYQIFNTSKKLESKITSVNVGLVTVSNEDIKRYQDLLVYFNTETGITWNLVAVPDYDSFMSKFQSGEVQAGFSGSAIAYYLIDHSSAVPLFRPEKNGVSTYKSVVIARRELGVKKLEDLKGKRFAYVDPYTTAGFLTVYAKLRERGFDPDDFFGLMTFVGSHDKVVKSILDDKFDGGALKSLVWNKLVASDPLINEKIEVVEEIGNYPDSTFIVDRKLSSAINWKDFLQKLNTSENGRAALEKFGIDRMIVTAPQDFSEVKKVTDKE